MVRVVSDLQPLNDFLTTDIGHNVEDLELVAHHARHPVPGAWGFGGDCCHVTITADEVLVENDVTGEQATLPRAAFVSVLRDYAAALREG